MPIVYPTKTLTVRYRLKTDGSLATPSSPLVQLRKLNSIGAGTQFVLGDNLTEQSPGVLTATAPGDPGEYEVLAGSSSQGDQVTPASKSYTVDPPDFPS